ncbi:hypothetical protein L915_03277 [Phytophthora nicotianae]|uniref:Uncharacterized protein n=3 Tax=Phytophthora nicotianae TaxID=4792 RepID=V9FRI3_PHYNI|nr:hypothetical protein F443_03402 [Phytophthora nicotianae P1569]ETK93571.1 hypothetical protein L915_03277 [Phytophthora nicotianae]ETL46963.1 hypothetical protein L916_03246 [Phytophthora nicotianae]ETM53253.1 hypothetical protein L914_03254 [Phytophthora nicotianae]ETO82374.1 hypothetical protein F444_03477 [Phytophthora nicotianae P1976]
MGVLGRYFHCKRTRRGPDTQRRRRWHGEETTSDCDVLERSPFRSSNRVAFFIARDQGRPFPFAYGVLGGPVKALFDPTACYALALAYPTGIAYICVVP